MNKRKKLLPYALVLGLSFITLLIINLGWELIHENEEQKNEIKKGDKARQILGSLAKGSKFETHLNRAAQLIKANLIALSKQQQKNYKILKSILPEDFPEHDLWIFSKKGKRYQTSLAPFPTRISRRGIAKVFTNLTENKSGKIENKLIDYFFGPGMKIQYLVLRKSRPSRVIYQEKPCILIWDEISTAANTSVGYFLLVPFSEKLNYYAMKTSFKVFNHAAGISKSTAPDYYAGYLKVFEADFGSMLPHGLEKHEEFKPLIKKWSTDMSLVKLERSKLPWGQYAGKDWQFFIKTIPYSSHLAFVFLKDNPPRFISYAIVKALNFFFIFSLFLLFAGYLHRIELPGINLKTRFTLLFFALASIPFSLLFISNRLYLKELRTSLEREARNELARAISSFDKKVDKVYLDFRKKLHGLRSKSWLLSNDFSKHYQDKPSIDMVSDYLESLDPPLPWGAIFLVSPNGDMLSRYASRQDKTMLEGVAQSSRVGLIEAMRLNKGLPSIEEGASSDFITDADIALKQAYETEVRLPVYHAFSNRIVGNTTKLALGESSIVRYIDYFPSAARPVTGLCLFWTENDLDKIFCLKAIKEVRKTNPGMGFNIYKSSGAGLTKIAQNLKNSDLKAEAQIAANRESQYFSRERNNLLKVAIPSKRRPNLILAGSMDINYIDKRINSLKKDYLLYAFLGIVALIFFLKLLHLRLIYPITHLIEYLENIKRDNFITAPISSRQDELKNIFEVYNQMVDGL